MSSLRRVHPEAHRLALRSADTVRQAGIVFLVADRTGIGLQAKNVLPAGPVSTLPK